MRFPCESRPRLHVRVTSAALCAVAQSIAPLPFVVPYDLWLDEPGRARSAGSCGAAATCSAGSPTRAAQLPRWPKRPRPHWPSSFIGELRTLGRPESARDTCPCVLTKTSSSGQAGSRRKLRRGSYKTAGAQRVPRKGRVMSRRKKIVAAVIASTVLGISAVGCAEAPSESSAEAAAPKATTAEKAEKPAREEAEKKAERRSPAETAGQENARESAKNYLSFSAFSRSGLIEQLQVRGLLEEGRHLCGGRRQPQLERAGCQGCAELPRYDELLSLGPHPAAEVRGLHGASRRRTASTRPVSRPRSLRVPTAAVRWWASRGCRLRVPAHAVAGCSEWTNPGPAG